MFYDEISIRLFITAYFCVSFRLWRKKERIALGMAEKTGHSRCQPASEKPRFIWIDAAANFPDFADSKENIARDLALAKDAGFTDVVVDVHPTTH